MTDDKAKKSPQDRSRINLGERCEVSYWRDKFGVSESELEAAVKKVGSLAADVDRYFRSEKFQQLSEIP